MLRRGGSEMALWLVSKGGDVNAKNGRGQTPLHEAARAANERAVVALTMGVDVRIEEACKRALRRAGVGVRAGTPNVGQVAGADVNAIDNNRRTPLHSAVAGGHPLIVLLLIRKGADVNATAHWERTPLHFAVRSDRRGIAEILLKTGAHIQARDFAGATPLHCWAQAGGKDAGKLDEALKPAPRLLEDVLG